MMSYSGASEESKDNEDFTKIPLRKEPVDPKLLKDILDALMQNNPDVAKKYNKDDLYALIQTLYEVETELPFKLPIYYNEEKGEARVDSNPVKRRTGKGLLIRNNDPDYMERGERPTENDGVKYNYPVSSDDRDLELGVYDFSTRDDEYDEEVAGQKRLGGRATRKANKHRKIRKSKKAHKFRKARKSKKVSKTGK